MDTTNQYTRQELDAIRRMLSAAREQGLEVEVVWNFATSLLNEAGIELAATIAVKHLRPAQEKAP